MLPLSDRHGVLLVGLVEGDSAITTVLLSKEGGHVAFDLNGANLCLPVSGNTVGFVASKAGKSKEVLSDTL